MSSNKSVEFTYFDMLRKVDPDFERARRKEVAYEFTGRRFVEDRDSRGPYAPRPDGIPSSDGSLLQNDAGYLLDDA